MKDVILKNLNDIQQNIQDACARSGRNPEDVRLIAVTKYAELPWVQELVASGQIDLGESRPQQLSERFPLFSESIRWHMIGQLQRNKIRKTLPMVNLIHSVHNRKLLDAINRVAEEESIIPSVLIQVNISGEESKQGWKCDELIEQWNDLQQISHLKIEGLMTMAPLHDNPEEARPFFRQLRELRDQLRDQANNKNSLPELSMGMSRDYQIAVEEGATLIRIGSQLFQGLK